MSTSTKTVLSVIGTLVTLAIGGLAGMVFTDHDAQVSHMADDHPVKFRSHEQLDMHEGARRNFKALQGTLDEIRADTRDTSIRVRAIETKQIEHTHQLQELDSDFEELKEEVRKKP